MKLQKLFSILFVAIAAITLHSCSTDTSDNTLQVSNIVTFQGNYDGQSVFTYQEMNDAQAITIRSNTTLDESKVKPGDRVYIVFNIDGAKGLANNDVVELLQAVGVPTVNTEVATIPENWQTGTGVYIQTLFRSGTWLNMQVLVPSTIKEMSFRLFADPKTINTENVELYMIYTNSEQDFGVSNVPAFVSFNIADVWASTSCRQITVHAVNTNYAIGETFTFKK